MDVNAMKSVVGTGLVVFGSVWLLDKLNMVDFREWVEFWPAILVGVGIALLLEKDGRHQARS